MKGAEEIGSRDDTNHLAGLKNGNQSLVSLNHPGLDGMEWSLRSSRIGMCSHEVVDRGFGKLVIEGFLHGFP